MTWLIYWDSSRGPGDQSASEPGLFPSSNQCMQISTHPLLNEHPELPTWGTYLDHRPWTSTYWLFLSNLSLSVPTQDIIWKEPQITNHHRTFVCWIAITLNQPPQAAAIMSFSNLVSDLALRDNYEDRNSQISNTRSQATARSYTSTAATSVSISGDISSQLHSGYSHPLSRSWQAERQLTKVCNMLYP